MKERSRILPYEIQLSVYSGNYLQVSLRDSSYEFLQMLFKFIYKKLKELQICSSLNLYLIKLCLVFAAENGFNFVRNNAFNSISCGSEVLSGVEVVGMLSEMLSNSTGHCQTKVGVDVDFANCHSCSLAEHFFGNTDSIGHFTAIGINHFNKLGNNGRSAV